MASAAPVCPVSRNQPVADMPRTARAFVPKAYDLPSAIAAANQAARAIQAQPTPNNVFPFVPGGDPGSKGPIIGTLVIPERWKEKERRTNTIRFYARSGHGLYYTVDKEQWIDVERIVYIRWHDKVQNVDFIVEWPYDPMHEAESKLLKVDGKDVGTS